MKVTCLEEGLLLSYSRSICKSWEWLHQQAGTEPALKHKGNNGCKSEVCFIQRKLQIILKSEKITRDSILERLARIPQKLFSIPISIWASLLEYNSQDLMVGCLQTQIGLPFYIVCLNWKLLGVGIMPCHTFLHYLVKAFLFWLKSPGFSIMKIAIITSNRTKSVCQI